MNVKNDKRPTGLILGSSHAFFGINGQFLDGVWYNLSSISQSINEDRKIIEYADSLNINIKNIIIPISYFTNFYNLIEAEVYGERIRIFDYQHTYGLDYSKKIDLVSRFYLLTAISQHVWKKDFTHSFDEHGNLLRKCTDSIGKFKDIEQIFKSHDFKSDFSGIHPDLDGIINFCNERNINLIFLVMPFTHGYNDRLKNTKFDAFLDNLKKIYSSKNISFHDERDFFSHNSEGRMFQDPDHLSACGQMIFSKHLNSIIKDGLQESIK